MPSKDSVLVTGASRGIGMETALRLAQSGFRVWASMRDPEQASPLLEEAHRRGVTLETVRLDVTRPETIDAAIDTILQRSGNLYGLVNNAGLTRIGYFEGSSDDDIRQVIEVNVIGVMSVTKRVLAPMREARRGRIVMMSSVGGRIAAMCMAPYFASKFALEGFSESLYLEMAPFGVQVVVVEPGMVKTDIWDESAYLPSSKDPQNPYFQLFRNMRAQTEALLRSSRITPANVADVVCRAFTSERPHLRYMVGWKARVLVALRRHLPGETFEKLYFGEVLKRVTHNVEGHKGTRP